MDSNNRRRFLHGMLAAGAVSATTSEEAQAQSSVASASGAAFLPFYARAQNYKSLKQSSYDKTGGNADRW